MTGIYQGTYMPLALHIFVPLHFYCSIAVDPHYTNQNPWSATFMYQTTWRYVPATNVPLKCHIYAIFQNQSTGITRLCMWVHIWTHCHQPYDQEWCTQTIMILMHMLTLMTMHPYHITWVSHLPVRPKSILTGPLHHLKKKIIQNQSFQDYHNLAKWELSKSVLISPPRPLKMKIIENQSFQDHHILPRWKMVKISPFQDHHTPSKVKSVQNYSFKDHHILPKWKLTKISPFKTPHLPKWKLSKIIPYRTTTSFQSGNCNSIITLV